MKELKTEIDRIMQEEIDSGAAIGTVCMIYKDNEEIYSGSFGRDNLKNDKRLDRNSVFRMFSMTKPITSAATMMMIERGLISPDDGVDKYLPGFKNLKVMNPDGTTRPAENRMTIKNLLDMTSGLEYPNDQTAAGKYLGENLFWPMEQGYPEKMIPTAELMNMVGTMPLICEPGEHWNYGLSADVLGAVIETVSGVSYGEWLEENIFKPLGMKDTGFCVPKEKWNRIVTMHDYDHNLKEWKEWEAPFLGTFDRRYKPAFESGGAGLVSTPDDYRLFALMLANEGTLPAEFSPSSEAVTLMKPETVRYMRTGNLTDRQKETADWYSLQGYNYGNLCRVLEDCDRAGLCGAGLGEFGWDGWAGTYVSIDPENSLIFLYFINVTNGNREWQMKKLKNKLYECLEIGKMHQNQGNLK